jgi:hypothetical protein
MNAMTIEEEDKITTIIVGGRFVTITTTTTISDPEEDKHTTRNERDPGVQMTKNYDWKKNVVHEWLDYERKMKRKRHSFLSSTNRNNRKCNQKNTLLR